MSDGPPTLSPDELTIYFHRHDNPYQTVVFVATRPGRESAFTTPAVLANVNSTGCATCSVWNGNPTVAADGLMLLFERVKCLPSDPPCAVLEETLWLATRPSPNDAFSVPIVVPGGVTTKKERNPFVQDDGLVLWLASLRWPSGLGGFDIYRAPREGNGFGAAILVSELSSKFDDSDPTLSKDGLTIFFATNRDNIADGTDIWTATRTSTSEPFSPPAKVTEVSTPYDELLSSDGCRLYISSVTPGLGSQIFVAERPR